MQSLVACTRQPSPPARPRAHSQRACMQPVWHSPPQAEQYSRSRACRRCRPCLPATACPHVSQVCRGSRWGRGGAAEVEPQGTLWSSGEQVGRPRCNGWHSQPWHAGEASNGGPAPPRSPCPPLSFHRPAHLLREALRTVPSGQGGGRQGRVQAVGVEAAVAAITQQHVARASLRGAAKGVHGRGGCLLGGPAALCWATDGQNG